MFTPVQLIKIPPTLQKKLEVVHKFVFGALGTMFAGMFIASGWYWLFDIKSTNLMDDSPLLLQVMMIGGFIAFIIGLLAYIALELWYDLRSFWS